MLSTVKTQVVHKKTGFIHNILWITFLMHKSVYFELLFTGNAPFHIFQRLSQLIALAAL